MALMQAKNDVYMPIISSARKFLINQQSDFDRKGQADNVFDGESDTAQPGLIRIFPTHTWRWRLFITRRKPTQVQGGELELDWDAAIHFVSNARTYLRLTMKNGLAPMRRTKADSSIFRGRVWQVKEKHQTAQNL